VPPTNKESNNDNNNKDYITLLENNKPPDNEASIVDKMRYKSNVIDNNYVAEENNNNNDFKNTVLSGQHIEVKGSDIVVKENNTYHELPAHQESIRSGKEEKAEEKIELKSQQPEEQQTLNAVVYTDKDFAEMTVEESIAYDRRSFALYYWKALIRTHLVLSAFIYKTLIKPQYIRIIACFLSISYYFALNAIFYSDSFIQARQGYNQSLVIFI
jgi:hypothetical protein